MIVLGAAGRPRAAEQVKTRFDLIIYARLLRLLPGTL
jgi:hypothetical protein